MASSVVVLTVPIFSDLCNLGFALRRQVFVAEQGVPANEEFDLHDQDACHLVAIVDGDVCGVMRVLFTPDHVKLGRVAVAAHRRGQGIGEAMIRHAMAEHGEAATHRFHLSSQSDKTGFYARFGFAAYGEEFDDVGIPHRAMKTY